MTSGMADRVRVRDLMVAHALGISSEEESAELEAAFRQWPDGRLELAALMRTADAFALTLDSSATPAIALEGRIMMGARTERSKSVHRLRRRAVRRQPAMPFRLRSLVPYGFAAALAVLAMTFGIMAFAEDPAPVGRWLPVQDESGATAAIAYVTKYRGEPVGLLLRGIPAPPDGSTYRLWHVHIDDSAVAGSTFQLNTESAAALPLVVPDGVEVVGFVVAVEPRSVRTGTAPAIPTRDTIRYTHQPEVTSHDVTGPGTYTPDVIYEEFSCICLHDATRCRVAQEEGGLALVCCGADAVGDLPLDGTGATVNEGAGEIGTIDPGGLANTTIEVAAGRYVLFCNVPGHYGAGMIVEFEVA